MKIKHIDPYSEFKTMEEINAYLKRRAKSKEITVRYRDLMVNMYHYTTYLKLQQDKKLEESNGRDEWGRTENSQYL